MQNEQFGSGNRLIPMAHRPVLSTPGAGAAQSIQTPDGADGRDEEERC